MKRANPEHMDLVQLLYRKGSITEFELNAVALWRFAMSGVRLQSRPWNEWGQSIRLRSTTRYVGRLTDRQERCLDIRRNWYRRLGTKKSKFLDYCLDADMSRAKIREAFGSDTAFIVDAYLPALLSEMAWVGLGKRRRTLIMEDERDFMVAA